MTDVALIWDNTNGRADFALVNGDLAIDDGLRTAAIVSLFTDALADAAASIPDGTDNRRGWPGDDPLPNAADTAQRDNTGSTLWLREGARQTEETRRLIESDVRTAFAWAITDGVADVVTASAAYPRNDVVTVAVTLQQGAVKNRFDYTWNAT